jgi:hypothetical protein
MAIAQLMYALTDSHNALFGVVGALGLAYGGMFSVVPTLTCEWFGVKSFSVNFGIMTLAAAAGANLIATLLGGGLLTKNKTAGHLLHVGDSTSYCLGRGHCFRTIFLVTAGLCFAAVALSVVLFQRRRAKRVFFLQ